MIIKPDKILNYVFGRPGPSPRSLPFKSCPVQGPTQGCTYNITALGLFQYLVSDNSVIALVVSVVTNAHVAYRLQTCVNITYSSRSYVLIKRLYSCQQLTEASHIEPRACLQRNNYILCDVSIQTDVAVMISAATTLLL